MSVSCELIEYIRQIDMRQRCDRTSSWVDRNSSCIDCKATIESTCWKSVMVGADIYIDLIINLIKRSALGSVRHFH